METVQHYTAALDRYIDLKASDDFDSNLIFTKLQELVRTRSENISDADLQLWTKEFMNFGMKTRHVLKKIQKLKNKKLGTRKIRFADFVNEEEFPSITFEMLKMESEHLIKEFLYDYFLAKEAKNFAELIYSSVNEDEDELTNGNSFNLNGANSNLNSIKPIGD